MRPRLRRVRADRRVVGHSGILDAQTRKSEFESRAEDASPIPDGKGRCPVCYRVVLLRVDGNLFAHNHCPGAPPTVGRRYGAQLCDTCGNWPKQCVCPKEGAV